MFVVTEGGEEVALTIMCHRRLRHTSCKNTTAQVCSKITAEACTFIAVLERALACAPVASLASSR